MLYRPTMKYSFLSFSCLLLFKFVVGGHKTHCLVPLMTVPWNRGWAFWAHLQRNCGDTVMTLTVVPYDLRHLFLALVVALKPSMFSEQLFLV